MTVTKKNVSNEKVYVFKINEDYSVMIGKLRARLKELIVK